MSEQLYTMANTKLFISKTPTNSKGEVTNTDFAGIEWVQVKGLYNLGELGGEQTINEFELIDEVWTRKTKGSRNGGTMTNQFIPMAQDEGQILYQKAIESCRPYKFKVERGSDCAPESEVTVSVADPAVVTWTDHGFFANQPIVFTAAEGGTLPTGLTEGTVYYVRTEGLTANTFTISATEGGPAVAVTLAGAGTITAVAPPVGMTDMFIGLATDGARSGGAKNDLYTRTWPIAVDGRVLTV